MLDERRHRRRIALDCPVCIDTDRGGTKAYRAHDFSMSGISFLSEDPFPIGNVLQMSMNIAPKGKVNIMKVIAEVVHIRTSGDKFVNGLRFIRKYI